MFLVHSGLAEIFHWPNKKKKERWGHIIGLSPKAVETPSASRINILALKAIETFFFFHFVHVEQLAIIHNSPPVLIHQKLPSLMYALKTYYLQAVENKSIVFHSRIKHNIVDVEYNIFMMEKGMFRARLDLLYCSFCLFFMERQNDNTTFDLFLSFTETAHTEMLIVNHSSNIFQIWITYIVKHHMQLRPTIFNLRYD